MGTISRGFFGRRTAADVKLPPGQYLTTDFPVLSAGPTPHIELEKWEFTIDDGTNVLRRWNSKSFRELPTENITVDLHCVTRWSKLGTHWEGVSLDTLLGEMETDFGAVATANTILENTAIDIPTVFGAGSPEAAEVTSNPGQAFADFVGIGVHCAQGSAICGAAREPFGVCRMPSHQPSRNWNRFHNSKRPRSWESFWKLGSRNRSNLRRCRPANNVH
jgi:Oxidoreductase molybdopterin binding domain